MHKSYRFRANNDPLKVKVSPHGVQEIDSKCTKIKSPYLGSQLCIVCFVGCLQLQISNKGDPVIELEKGDQQNEAPE
jgi:hypothetical protein